MSQQQPDPYLDTAKSVLISSPAGSGKTEKLARRYIALLKNGSDVERILAITFTEKAAAEMKERILSLLRREDPELFDAVREKMPRMRISTIHSFCLKLLKRFCLELDMDISLEVMDGFSAAVLWEEAVYEALLADAESAERPFYEAIKDNGLRGWPKLYGLLKTIHEKRPGIEFGVLEAGGIAAEGPVGTVLAVYLRCLERYRLKKRQRRLLDYNDLELLAYRAVSATPEWQSILYSFDEHTDHILVDEFQDTSSLQWRIIDRLTEEWRAGLGGKREAGLTPTVFLVGDDKQSIYSFRGANAGIFKNVRRKFAQWLGDDCHFIEVKENYRSLPAIVDFVNAFFGRLMPPGLYDDWKVEYVPFAATRQGRGRVELLVGEGGRNAKESRRREAALLARKIKGLRGVVELSGGGAALRCDYGDMAILLRGRTHLSTFEDALRREGVPFIVVKGIGFYSTPEIVILRDLLFFLIDPRGDYSLFNLLRSPLFKMRSSALLDLLKAVDPETLTLGSLYELLGSYESLLERPLVAEVRRAAELLGSWLERARQTPYAVLLEEILAETGAWRSFSEKQRTVNVKKFIKLVEELEAGGVTSLELREKLLRASSKAEEPKANVSTEGMNAVKIMTVHASKGLQFPMVFLPCLDEGGPGRTGSFVLDEEGDRIVLGYEEDAEARRESPLFRRHKEKAEDEEKRLFYVAATRAMDYLCMSGVLGKKPTGKLAALFEVFGIDGEAVPPAPGELPFTLERVGGSEAEVSAAVSGPPPLQPRLFPAPEEGAPEPLFIEPLEAQYRPALAWRDVTEEVETIRRKHGEDWVVLGRIFHRVFEGLSKGQIAPDRPEAKVRELVRSELLPESDARRMNGLVLDHLRRLEESGLLREIILPREHSYAELPFILELGHTVYKGRIDRVVIDGGRALVYDYKTFPVTDEELPELARQYAFQLHLYKKAVERLFSLETEAALFFTHALKIVR